MPANVPEPVPGSHLYNRYKGIKDILTGQKVTNIKDPRYLGDTADFDILEAKFTLGTATEYEVNKYWWDKWTLARMYAQEIRERAGSTDEIPTDKENLTYYISVIRDDRDRALLAKAWLIQHNFIEDVGE
jgi:hypothetical protein